MSAVRLSDEVLNELEQICGKRRFKPGEVVTLKGENRKSMFFILAGWVDIRFFEEGNDASSLRVGERSVLGEMGFLTGESAVATAVAVSAVTALEMDKNILDQLEAKNPQAAQEFSQYLVATVDRRLR